MRGNGFFLEPSRFQRSILLSLCCSGPSYGLDIKRRIGGEPWFRSLYIALQELMDNGLVERLPDPELPTAARGGYVRYLYAVTESGCELVR